MTCNICDKIVVGRICKNATLRWAGCTKCHASVLSEQPFNLIYEGLLSPSSHVFEVTGKKHCPNCKMPIEHLVIDCENGYVFDMQQEYVKSNDSFNY